MSSFRRFVTRRTMTERKAKVLSEKDKGQSMSDAAFYRDVMREAFPVPRRHMTVKEAVNAAVRFIAPKVRKEFGHRRARSIWEGTARRIDAEEAAALHRAQIEEDRREYRELKDRLASLEASFAVADEAFFGPQMDAYRCASSPLGRVDRPRIGED
jgi:hypothetical protein